MVNHDTLITYLYYLDSNDKLSTQDKTKLIDFVYDMKHRHAQREKDARAVKTVAYSSEY